ncbi:MAG: TatD family hydrolase [Oscillospiraceae bacterium]|nr:TatD family hydrolase [Oscillospiraceae bacterium]
MIRLTDTHAHYDDAAFEEDRYQLLDHLFEYSVDKIVTVGCSYDRWRPTLQLAECYNDIYAALGIHPEDIYDLPPDYLQQLENLTKNSKVKAIGEMGLDYHYENYDRELQIKVFREQLQLADYLSMPAIIHSRDATADTLGILRELRPKKAVMHCFSGSAETAREVLDLGLYISFTGVLTFKNAVKAAEACREVPLDRLMLETDCPYMAPVPHRGERCDSSMLRFTAEKIAEIKGITVEEVAKACNENADRFFEI